MEDGRCEACANKRPFGDGEIVKLVEPDGTETQMNFNELVEIIANLGKPE
jgi:hypothetical protein